MNSVATSLEDVYILEPYCHQDERGFFLEAFRQDDFESLLGHPVCFVQDNHSFSMPYVLRGLHMQVGDCPQAKLVRVLRGGIFDVVVDLRPSSSSYRKWFGTYLSEENKRQLWIPEGCAHGFLVLSQASDILYKTNNYWSSKDEICICWDDPELAIEWPLPVGMLPTLSKKDSEGVKVSDLCPL